jgi:hypothetical protein
MRRHLPFLGLLASFCVATHPTLAGEPRPAATPADPAAIEFFEKSVRPILVNRCQSCHGETKQKGGLRLDHQADLITGGTTGPAVVPGKPAESLFIEAINYGDTVQMPPKSKLPAGEIAILTQWVERGATWGIETSPGNASPNPNSRKPIDPKQQFRDRARFWSFQPLNRPIPPSTTAGWTRNPIDQFILAALNDHQLAPTTEAPRRTLIRRLTFDLTGLPPTPGEINAFLADHSPNAYESLVDRLLASPRYGERWGRHWLDLVRYAETAGHEFDFDIPQAYRYRDYVVRALNADLPYNQFVLEHIAGDLLESPRRNPATGLDESAIATGFYYLGEGTHSPVDVREEEVRRIDNQIDVISKTFLGLTLACARCHDHKFDPITASDYYALSGFIRSSRHQYAFIDPPSTFETPLRNLAGLKEEIATLLKDSAPTLPDPLKTELTAATRECPDKAANHWSTGSASSPTPDPSERLFEDFNRGNFDGWSVTGQAFGDRPSALGDFRLDLISDKPALIPIPPGQAHSGLRSDRLHGVLRSRTFTLESRYIHYRLAGRHARINVLVDNFEKIRDPIYGALTIGVNVGDTPRWVTQDVGMWKGEIAYIEIGDGAVGGVGGGNIEPGHGYIAIDAIYTSNNPKPPTVPTAPAPVPILLEDITKALGASPHPDRAVALTTALDRHRRAEAAIPDPTFAIAIADGPGFDERILVRGNHKSPGELAPRRFLEVLGGTTPTESTTPDPGSGRLDLARRIVDTRANPLIARVLVNRLWKHHFGDGLVRSTDDFGAMGQPPSNPQLLDWLATEFVRQGWSLKAMHRLMLTSSTYRMSCVARNGDDERDPNNTYLHRMNVHRLEAESIRDALLAVSGQLDPTMAGPSVPTYLTDFMDGRGRPTHSGPMDGNARRSLYLAVRRNFLNPIFLAFDTPVPFSTMGRRNVSNVPAQALTLMNDPLVLTEARHWAKQSLAGPARSASERLEALYLTAFGRPPTESETRACLQFLASQTVPDPKSPDAQLNPWVNLCHVLVNMKEFIFID